MEDLDPADFDSEESYDKETERLFELANKKSLLSLKRYNLHYDSHWPKSIIQRNVCNLPRYDSDGEDRLPGKGWGGRRL